MSAAESLARCLEGLASHHKSGEGEDTITSYAVTQAAVLVRLLHEENERLRAQAANIAGVNTRVALIGCADPFDRLVAKHESLLARLATVEQERDAARAELQDLRERAIQITKQPAHAS
ncbi:hypothetical protein [Methylobacterium oxalidis]|uniref:hypothetical protein n=1 Tax=Methylobacterium oxalidis TaxID=944322 RepID=UPI0033162FC2